MPPRILIFVAAPGAGARAAAGAACERAEAGTARPLSLEQGADAELRSATDRLAESLDLRPIAGQLAVLGRIVALLRERPDALIAIDAPSPGALVALLAAADLARARLDASRPAAGASTLAARRAGEHPDLPVLRAAALAGDLLRSPELTTTGLLTAGADPVTLAGQRAALTLAGLALLREPLPLDPLAAAATLQRARDAGETSDGAAPVTHPLPGGADIALALGARPAGLRAVRSGGELAVSAGEAQRRLRAPAALGALVPSGVSAGEDGALIAHFREAGA